MKNKTKSHSRRPTPPTHVIPEHQDGDNTEFKRAPIQKKSLSQVFLKTDEPLKKVSSALTSLGIQRVLEIGPGGGILTEELVKKGLQVTAIEKDARFAEHLAGLFNNIEAPKGASLELVHQDFLKYPVEEWIGQSQSSAAIVGNIPYHISSLILQKIVEHISPPLNAIVLMTQKEFAERLAASVGSKDYGSLSVYVQLRLEIQILEIVPRQLFTPVPKVDSAIFLALPLAKPFDTDQLKFTEKVTKLAFAQRRKKLLNSLSQFLAHKSLSKDPSPLDLNLRADALTPLDFYKLSMWLQNP